MVALPAQLVRALRGSSVHLAVQGAYLFDRVWDVPVLCEDVVWYQGQRSGTFPLVQMMLNDFRGTPQARLRAEGVLKVLPDQYWPDLEVLRNAGIRISRNRRRLTTSRFDIVDLGSREAWEIKPNNRRAIDEGRDELAERITMFNSEIETSADHDKKTDYPRRDLYGWKPRKLRPGVSWKPPREDIYVGLRTYVRVRRLTDDPTHRDAGLLVYDVYRDGGRVKEAAKTDDTLEALKEELYVQIANRNLMVDIAQPVSAVMAILALAVVTKELLATRALTAAEAVTETEAAASQLPAEVQAIEGFGGATGGAAGKAQALNTLTGAAVLLGGGQVSAATGKDVTAANASTWDKVRAVKGFLWEMFATDEDTKEWWATVRGTPFAIAARNPLQPRPVEERPPARPDLRTAGTTPQPPTPAARPAWAAVKEDDDIQRIATCLARRLQYGVDESSPTARMQTQVIRAWLDGFSSKVGGLRSALTMLAVPDSLDPRNQAHHESIAAAVFAGSPDTIRSINRHTAIWDWYLWEDPDILQRMVVEPEMFGPAEDQAGARSEYPDWREIVVDR